MEECEFIQKFLLRDSTLLIVLEIYLFYVVVVFVETDIIVGFHEIFLDQVKYITT